MEQTNQSGEEIFSALDRRQGVAGGSKSAAFRLALRADGRSITAAGADGGIQDVLTALKWDLGAALRKDIC